MPLIKTKSGGYKYGKSGKVYKSRATLQGGFCPIERSLNSYYNSLNTDLTEVI